MYDVRPTSRGMFDMKSLIYFFLFERQNLQVHQWSGDAKRSDVSAAFQLGLQLSTRSNEKRRIDSNPQLSGLQENQKNIGRTRTPHVFRWCSALSGNERFHPGLHERSAPTGLWSDWNQRLCNTHWNWHGTSIKIKKFNI